MRVFWIMFQAVCGIIAPFVLVIIIVGLIYVLVGYLEYCKTVEEYKIEELKKQPPFNEVETSLDYSDKSLKVRFIKNNEVIWSGALKDSDGRLTVL